MSGREVCLYLMTVQNTGNGAWVLKYHAGYPILSVADRDPGCASSSNKFMKHQPRFVSPSLVDERS